MTRPGPELSPEPAGHEAVRRLVHLLARQAAHELVAALLPLGGCEFPRYMHKVEREAGLASSTSTGA
jgi:hypothetical protein